MERAGEVLKRFFNVHDFSKGSIYADVFRGWEGIVGEKMAGHSRILDLAGKALVVEVDHPASLQVISMQKKKILSAVRRKYPDLDIKALKFRVKLSSLPAAPVPQKAMQKVKSVESEKDVKNIEAGELKQALERLYNSVVNKQNES